jgi:hypothetical protein
LGAANAETGAARQETLLARQQLEREIADLRRVEIVLAEERRAHLAYRKQGDELSRELLATGAALEIERLALRESQSGLAAANAAAAVARQEVASAREQLECEMAELRRMEIVLAEERRAHLAFRARSDELQALKETLQQGMSLQQMKDIAKEVWWERNRRGLPYKLVKWVKRLFK